MRQKLPIFECQQHSNEDRTWHSQYEYLGIHPSSGLHIFREPDGPPEYFAKRRSVAGWHLVRGEWAYEFVTSKQPNT